jgi:hypothetical protein
MGVRGPKRCRLGNLTPDEFWQHFSPCPITGCYWWMGSFDERTGYGMATVDGIKSSVHRHVVRLTSGPLPDRPAGFKVTRVWACHRCAQPACGNPMHVYRGSPSSNSRDTIETMKAAGTWASAVQARTRKARHTRLRELALFRRRVPLARLLG